jgi:hypothetical protein
VQADSNNGLTDENAMLSIVPMPLTATTAATLMPAATNVHLMAVARRSTEVSEEMYFILVPLLLLPSKKGKYDKPKNW